MNIEELRQILSTPTDLRQRSFEVLQAISRMLNLGQEHEAREMILRALEHRSSFAEVEEILEALVRETGLFPYLEQSELSLADRLAYEYHKPLNLEQELVFHRQQAEIYRRLMDRESVILSAPTSFGKSRIIDAIVASGRFNNIVVIVPTIALIDETRRRLSSFSGIYKIVTQISQEPADKNIFVFTAERANAYPRFPRIEFFVIDEFYKIGALSEDKQRTVALNQAFYKFAKQGAQFYMLGPCVREIPRGLEDRFHCSFYSTEYATVVSEEVRLAPRRDDISALIELCKGIHEQTLVFCKSPKRVNDVARALVASNVGIPTDLQHAADWIAREFHEDWILPRALLRGIGIHHGRLPRSIGQFMVRAFNEEQLRFLICTSTLIEGVNTKAKNVIILDNEIAQQKYDYFTFNNIKGRSGRMFHHFIGRVFLFHAPPTAELPFIDFPVFSQGADTPNSILVQMEDQDLTADAKDRIEQFRNQSLLPLEILREQSISEPENLLALAEELYGLSRTQARNLSWRGFPRYEQLEFCSELLWRHLVERAHAGVFSGRHLAFKVNKLGRTPNIRDRVMDELRPGQYAAENADEAVERVLEFDRSWASFELPRLFSALNAVQEHVLGKRGLPIGNYNPYVRRVESLFRGPFQIALEEYGLPLQVTDRLSLFMRSARSIDEALDLIRDFPFQVLNDRFERELVEDCISHL